MNREVGLSGWEASVRAVLLLFALHVGLYKKLIFKYAGNLLIYPSGKELEHCRHN